jgi:signal transduction histidine kinase/Na+/proline symporter
MSLELGTLLAIGIAYLVLLFAIAWLTDRNVIPATLASHPLVYTLSLGVFAGGWSFFGMAGVGDRYGLGYLGYFIGVGSLFLFSPLLLLPLHRISRRMQFTSLADLLAYRYRGRGVGAIVTLSMLIASLPLVAAQIRVVSEVASILTGTPDAATHARVGLVFATAIGVFAILFGARPISDRERHSGLVVTMAFESLVKVVAVLLVGGFALFAVLSEAGGAGRWLEAHPQQLAVLHESTRSSSTHVLALTFMAAATGLPHLLHMALHENPSMRAVQRASWAFPLLLLLLSLPVLPTLWAGLQLDVEVVEYSAAWIGLAAGSPVVALTAFVVALSGASASIIVITLALASMSMNNFVLPFYGLGSERDLYRGLVTIRSVLIALIIVAAQFFSLTVAERSSLESLGFAAFVAAAQFFPGTLALLYWPRANRAGFLSGLLAGYAVWLLMVLAAGTEGMLAIAAEALPLQIAGNHWATASINSLVLNTLLLIVVSWISRQGAEEREAAASCSLDNLSGRGRHPLQVSSPAQFVTRLAEALGQESAQREVARALRDLGYEVSEARPYAMRRLRDRIEANLSRLMGASVAIDVVNRSLPYAREVVDSPSEDIHLVESRLESWQRHLTGFVGELDELRRFYRNTLQDLPVGVCGVNTDGEIVMWNDALEQVTCITAAAATGSTLNALPAPWAALISGFADSGVQHLHQQRILRNGEPAWISLHKTLGDTPVARGPDARFILIEDVTGNQLLQEELIHSERLASIGRLAAGVAHEIGNPVTGIDFLAQNLLAESADEGVRHSAQQILNQTHRIGNIVNSLVNFAHTGAEAQDLHEQLLVAQCVDEAIYLLSLDRGARSVSFVNACDPQLGIRANGQKLLQVFVNLLSNARDASRPGQEIRIEGRAWEDAALIEVVDSGCGIPSAQIDKIFEPFFTTKTPGEGTGLGLALVYSIVKDLGGSITATSPAHSGRGTRISVQLPLRSPRAGTAADSGVEMSAPSG